MFGGGFNNTSQPNVLITSGIVNTSSLVGGSSYVLEKTQITVTGAGGSGAVITPTITTNAISALTITSAGKRFLTTPTISITSGITGTTSITAGSGYNDSTYNLGVSCGGGSGCTGTFTISSGGLTSISIINAGTGNTSAPTLSFPLAGPGSSAVANQVHLLLLLLVLVLLPQYLEYIPIQNK